MYAAKDVQQDRDKGQNALVFVKRRKYLSIQVTALEEKIPMCHGIDVEEYCSFRLSL